MNIINSLQNNPSFNGKCPFVISIIIICKLVGQDSELYSQISSNELGKLKESLHTLDYFVIYLIQTVIILECWKYKYTFKKFDFSGLTSYRSKFNTVQRW